MAIAYTALTGAELTALLKNVVTVHGSISIESCGTLTEIALDELTTVGGGIEVLTLAGCAQGHSEVTAIRMPKLFSVGAELVVRDTYWLVELNLDQLATAGGKLWIAGVYGMPGLSFPSLQSVGGAFEINISLVLSLRSHV